MGAPDRLHEELARLRVTIVAAAEQAAVDRKTIYRWLGGTPIPSDALARLAAIGLDVQYLVTGVRSGNRERVTEVEEDETRDPVLAKDEWELIAAYRSLAAIQREQARAMIKVLATGMSLGGGASIVGRHVVASAPGSAAVGGGVHTHYHGESKKPRDK